MASKPKESVSSTVSRAKAMLAQTKAQGSKPFAGSGYDVPGQTVGASTAQPSDALKKLSIDNATPLASSSTTTPSTKGTPSKLISELSIGLAKGQNITQDQINSARTSGASLLSTPVSSPTTSPSSPTGTPSSNQTSVVGGTKGGKYSRYGLYKPDEPVVETPSYEDIQKQLMRDAQRQVNSLRKYENSLLEEQSQINQENQRQNAAVNTLTGLAGSSEANVTTQRVTQEGQRANQQIQAQIQTQIQGVLADVRKDAQARYQFERSESRLDQAQADTRNKEAYTRAQTNATLLSASGATPEGYKATDPEGYQYLADTLGGEDVLKAMFTLNRPQEQIVDKKMEGGKYIVAYQNPLDGKLRIETVDLGLPPQYTKTIDAGDRILAIPDNWSGDPSELITVNKGLTPGQQADNAPSSGQGIYDVLDFRTANSVISQADKFTSSDIVKRFNNIQDSRNNIALIEPTTQNPADHQAIVYYFAKALDPESVVREGEYETIKKYAQNIFGRYKGEINNAINGSGFLSSDAIQNIKDTIDNRYTSGLQQYQNKANETARVINTIAGKDVAGMVLTDYEGGAYGGNNPQANAGDALSDEEAYQEYLRMQNGS